MSKKKKMQHLDQFTPVEVTWRDAQGSSGWMPIDAFELAEGLTRTVGLVFDSDEDFLIIVLTYDWGIESINGYIAVPWGMVESVKVLEEAA